MIPMSRKTWVHGLNTWDVIEMISVDDRSRSYSPALFRLKMQGGMTLIELLVAVVVGLIATAAMVGLMANTLGTGTRTIEMTRLQQEMRSSMQLITRELRRANFHINSENCFAAVDCNPDDTKLKNVQADGDCVQFWYDLGGDGALDVSAFQLVTRSSVNIVQISQDEADDCGTDWGMAHDVTDPDIINVTTFTIGDESFNEVISEVGDTQTVNRLRLTMTAQLLTGLQGGPVSRTIEDLVYVRNHTLCPGGACP
jgi:prepilin-type N-terminal cleavage/methylation domain-containing protein